MKITRPIKRESPNRPSKAKLRHQFRDQRRAANVAANSRKRPDPKPRTPKAKGDRAPFDFSRAEARRSAGWESPQVERWREEQARHPKRIRGGR